MSACRRRYAYDTIHNAIAKARSPLERGGYSRVSCEWPWTPQAIMTNASRVRQMCHLVEESISRILSENDNTSYLLNLHNAQRDNVVDMGTSPNTRSVKIK